MINWFCHMYPYGNLHELNLDWVIATVKHGEKEIADFIGVNTIKYANPILWNIESQYEANTVVIDGQTGNAYISVKAVPSGVHLNREEYWTQIYNYASVIDGLRKQIAYDEGESTTATQPYVINDLVFVNGVLYRVIAPMIAGDSFVSDSNVVQTTINAEISRLHGFITDEASARQSADTQLQTNIDNEASARQSADTQLQTNIDNEASARQSADNTLQNNINAEASARENADDTLQTNIEAEASARENADTQLQTLLEGEIETASEQLKNQFISPIKKFIFIGDSYAVGFVPGGSEIEGGIVGFYNRVISKLNIPSSKYTLIKWGRSGFLATGINNKTWYDDLYELDNDSDVTDIFVIGGLNDVSLNQDLVYTAITNFVSLAKSKFVNASVHIGFAGRCSVPDSPFNIVNLRACIDTYRNATINSGANYLDRIENVLKAPQTMASDNYHPNDLGENYLSYYLINYIVGRQLFFPNQTHFKMLDYTLNKQALEGSDISPGRWGYFMDNDTVTFMSWYQQGFTVNISNHQLRWVNHIELFTINNNAFVGDQYNTCIGMCNATVNTNEGFYDCSATIFINGNVVEVGLQCLNTARNNNPTVNITSIYLQPFRFTFEKKMLY